MADTWWIIDNGDGSYRQVVTDGADPSSVGEIGDAYEMTRRGDLTFEVPNLQTGEWADAMEPVRARLIEKISLERQAAQDALLSPGDGKKMVYTQKNNEQIDYYANGPLPDTRARFPAAYAEMDVSGITLAQAIAQFKAGAEAVNGQLYRFDALALKAKRDVENAETAAEAELAAHVDWE